MSRLAAIYKRVAIYPRIVNLRQLYFKVQAKTSSEIYRFEKQYIFFTAVAIDPPE